MLYNNDFDYNLNNVDNIDDIDLNDEGMLSLSQMYTNECEDEYGDDYEEDFFLIKHLSTDTNYVYRVNNSESLFILFETIDFFNSCIGDEIEEYVDVLLENCFFPCDIYISIDEDLVEVGEYY